MRTLAALLALYATLPLLLCGAVLLRGRTAAEARAALRHLWEKAPWRT